MSTSTLFECETCPKTFRLKNAAHQHMRDKAHYMTKNENEKENEPVCLDWVFSNLSNVHVAKDRGWFTEYTPFETEIGDFYGMMPQPIRVIGIGTVELLTEPPPNAVRQDLPRPLRLTTVLHAPSAMCNIIGMPIVKDYEVISHFSGDTKGFIADKQGRHIAYFDPSCPLFGVKLRDPPVGTYVLKHGGGYLINAKWAETEWEKWHAHQNNIGGPLTKEEKIWLKNYFGDEFHFLREHGMSIYKEEDREDGRRLLRAFMQADKEQSVARGWARNLVE